MKPGKLIIIAALMLLLHSCYYDKGDKLYPNVAPCDTAAMTFNAHIKPILDNNCVSCHKTGSVSGNVNLDSYTGVTATIPGSKLLNAVKHLSGGGKNMPPGSKLSDCNIRKMEAWITRGYPQQ